MAGNIKGIIVEIGGDTSGLQNALKKVNSATASLSKELKGINTMLKLDPKNTELLAQKQTVLKQNISETTKKLDMLKATQAEFIKMGGDVNSENYRALRREIIATEQKLKELKIQSSNWTNVSNALKEVENKMNNWGATIEKIGKQLTTKVSLPIIALGTAATKSAIDFESAFAGVEKTVDGTAEQMANLKKGIKDMAQEIPSSTTEIAEVAEAAGQLGIQTDNIIGFSKAMIDLGNSTNLTSSEAASQLAKFANIMQMSQKDFDKLGSSIVDLGNNFATTEADIVSMAMRLAGAGKQVGLSEGQVLGLSTALSSVGIEAEMGGSAISKAMIKMQNAVEMGGDKLNIILKKTGMSLRDLELLSANNSKDFKALANSIGMTSTELKQFITAGTNLEDFSKVAGMSAEEFKKAWKEDAAGALTSFIKGLGDAESKGESAITMLTEMGLTEVRLRDSLLRAANAGDLFNNAIETGTKAWDENVALTNEANKRYQTLASKIQVAKNKLYNLGITIGEIIMPYIEKTIDFVSNLTEKFKKINPNIQKVIVKILAITAAIGPCVTILGKLIKFGGSIAGGLSRITGWIARVSASTSGLSGVISALAGPIGIVIAVIAALTAAFVYFFNTNSEFHDKVINVWNGICDMFTNQVMPILEELWQTIQKVVKQIIDVVMDLWHKIEPIILEMLNWMLDFWESTLKDIVVQVIQFVAKLYQFQAEIYAKFILPIIKFLLDTLWPVVEWIIKNVIQRTQDVMQHIGNIVKSVMGILNGIITFISGVFSGDWEKAWKGVKDIFSNLMGGLWEIVKWPLNKIIDGLNTFINGINKVQIPDWVPNVGGKGLNIPNIPRLAKGAIVNQATIAMIGEGKSAEAVIPLDRTLTKYMAEAMKEAGGTRNITLNFYPQQMNEQELDRAFDYVERKFSLAY